MGLSKEQIARYSRQLILPQVGIQGQQRLLNSSVLIIGAGGLGSPVALYLAAAGVGRLGLIDRDVVEPSDLHRQILHATSDVGQPKTEAARTRLTTLNPDVHLETMQENLNAVNVKQILATYDVVVDGSDNFTTRYLVNDACVLLGKPLVHGGVVHVRGHVMTILPRQTACFRCVFPEPPAPGAIPSCQDAGVVGAVAGVLGSLMAHEALKLLLGLGEPLTNRLLVFDGTTSRCREVTVRRNTACAVCGQTPTIRELVPISEITCEAEEETWRKSR